MSELLPCPFCGGEAEYRNDPTTGFVCATCTSLQCGTIPRTPWYSTKTKAAEAWNTRPATTIGQVAVEVVPTVRTCTNTYSGSRTLFKCSECGGYSILDCSGPVMKPFPYCQKCGARVMEVDE